MVKKMVFAAAALALTAGSLFAFADKAPEKEAATAKCAPSCCDGSGQGGDGCCE